MDHFHLHCHHGQNFHRNPIELIKAAPGPGLHQPLVDISYGLDDGVRHEAFNRRGMEAVILNHFKSGTTLVDYLILLLTYLVVHLLRTVEHINHHAKGSSKIFGGFGFPCTSGASWSPAHGQVEWLGESNVTPSSNRKHTEQSNMRFLDNIRAIQLVLKFKKFTSRMW